MEKVGMRREGHLLKNTRAHDGWRDSYVYALLADEWRAANR
jgi:RimJ/RimL family protein N-acetyltransferase